MNGGTKITLFTPQFTKVGNTDTNFLYDITCPVEMYEQVQLYTLTEGGSLLDKYYWSADDDENLCWYNTKTGQKAENIGFTPGQAFWIQCDADGEGDISSSGEVSTKDVTTELNGGTHITLVGNASPVKIYLQEIYCPVEMYEQVQLYTLTEGGALNDKYYWSADDEENLCWYNTKTGQKAENVSFDPGQAFWIQCDAEEGGTITFPGPEL